MEYIRCIALPQPSYNRLSITLSTAIYIVKPLHTFTFAWYFTSASGVTLKSMCKIDSFPNTTTTKKNPHESGAYSMVQIQSLHTDICRVIWVSASYYPFNHMTFSVQKTPYRTTNNENVKQMWHKYEWVIYIAFAFRMGLERSPIAITRTPPDMASLTYLVVDILATRPQTAGSFKGDNIMMTSSYWSIFRVIVPFVSGTHRWSLEKSLTKASDAVLCCFLWFAPEQTFEQTTETLVIWDAIALIMTSP